MNDNFFKFVHISNFKSLKDVTLKDCKRINLLIGKPNVGKSNILEAIGLFSLPYLKYSKNRKLTQFIRLENIAELFFDGDKNTKTEVHAGHFSCTIEFLKDYSAFNITSNNFTFDAKLNNELNLRIPSKRSLISHIKYYKYSNNPNLSKSDYNEIFNASLIPPLGNNLLDVLENEKLKKEIDSFFFEYNLKLVFDKASNSVKFMKILSNDDIFLLPYNSIADTLQRIIFYKAAIASNENSILLFEEPEAHCFPPYIAHIAKEIIDSESNQFFIATHSPFILDTFLEDARSDLAIYMTDFKEGQTVIKRLTDDEVNEVYEYGLDLFFNSELFTDEI